MDTRRSPIARPMRHLTSYNDLRALITVKPAAS